MCSNGGGDVVREVVTLLRASVVQGMFSNGGGVVAGKC